MSDLHASRKTSSFTESVIRDMTRLVNTDKKKGDLDRVVTVDVGIGKLIGFVTQEHANTLGIGGVRGHGERKQQEGHAT